MTKQPRFNLNTNLRWFIFAMVLANIAGQMGRTMMPLYLLDLGASVPQVGMVFTLASLVPLALQILGGWLSDNIGRLRAIALGSFVAVFGWLVVVLAPSWQWVLVGLCLEYVSGSFVGPSFSAYVAEQSSEEERGRVFGLTGSIFNIVTVIGPALAGLLAYRYGFRIMLAVGLLFYAAATGLRVWMALAARFAPPRKSQKPTLAGLRKEMGAMFALLFAGGILTWIWITDAIADTGFNLIGQLYPIYLSDVGGLNLAQIGVLNAILGGAVILATLASGWLTDRYSERVLIAAGFLIQGLALAVLLQVSGVVGFGLAMIIFGLGIGCLSPAYNALISKVVPEDRRGLAFGLFGTSLGILSLPFPWIGAQLWERFSPQTPFWITVAACAAAVPLVLAKFVLPTAQPSEASEPSEG